MDKAQTPLSWQPPSPRSSRCPTLSKLLSLVLLALVGASLSNLLPPSLSVTTAKPATCQTPLPPLSHYGPLDPSHPALVKAAQQLTRALQSLYKKGTLDSLALAVVTHDGPVFELTLGAKRANETDPLKRGEVDRDTSYRIASVSKLFTTLETLILQERGVLHLDDPITRFFPNFTYLPFGCPSPGAPHCSPEDAAAHPLTLRQLATHMSGIARDLPFGVAQNWPTDRAGDGPPPMNGLPFPNASVVLDAISKTPLITPPWTSPIYSNTGFSLLGACNVQANILFGPDGDAASKTHAELMKRDVFDKLGMEGSFFLATEENKGRIAVPSVESREVDLDFLDWSNPSGGQFSSLADLSMLLHSLLSPTSSASLLSEETKREWMRPWHAYGDDLTEMGLVWEITKVQDTWGGRQRVFQKYGNLAASHSAFALAPESGYGIALLTTSPTSQTQALVQLALKYFQPAFDRIRQEHAQRMFGGPWVYPASRDGKRLASEGRVTFRQGQLWVDKLVLNGTDVLELLAHKRGVRGRLWWMGGEEFRVAVDYPGFEGGCFGQMAVLDEVGRKNGAAINLVRYMGPASHRSMAFPAAGVTMRRKL